MMTKFTSVVHHREDYRHLPGRHLKSKDNEETVIVNFLLKTSCSVQYLG